MGAWHLDLTSGYHACQKTLFILNNFQFYSYFFSVVFLWLIFNLVRPILDPIRGQNFFIVWLYQAWPLVPSSDSKISPKTELLYWFWWILTIFSLLWSFLLTLLILGGQKSHFKRLDYFLGASWWPPKVQNPFSFLWNCSYTD